MNFAVLVAVLTTLSPRPEVLPGTPPSVLRVHVPTQELADFFPGLDGLRSLPYGRFLELLAAAEDSVERQRIQIEPRIVRAEHEARWDEGTDLLVGRSRFLIEGTGGADGRSVILKEWSPAVRSVGPDTAILLNRPDGELTLRAEGPAASWVVVGWALRAGEGGRSFDLVLPGPDSMTVVLDLPESVRPGGTVAFRDEPRAARAAGRRVWRADGSPGLMALRLFDADDPVGASRRVGAWVGGATRVEIEDGAARWRVDWIIEPAFGSDGLAPLVVDLEPGTLWSAVEGSDVASIEPSIDSTSGRVALTILWKGPRTGPSKVEIRGLAPLPAAGGGRWPLPAVRPREAAWLGGVVDVRVGRGWTVAGCDDRDGRSIPPGPADERGDVGLVAWPRLRFESLRPGPAAVLELRAGAPRVTSAVRGTMEMDGGIARVRARVALDVRQGILPELALDLTPGWAVDRVHALDSTVEADWTTEGRPDGGTRVRIQLPVDPSLTGASQTLLIEASAAPGADGTLAEFGLPRLEPIDTLVDDEVWFAWLPPSLRLVPVAAHGLAWLDPALVGQDQSTRTKPGAGLAWRWLEDDAAGRVRLVSQTSAASATVDQEVSVHPDQVFVRWRIEVRPDGRPIDELTIAIRDGALLRTSPRWWLTSEEGRAPLDATPFEKSSLTEAGSRLADSAQLLRLPGRVTSPVRLEGEVVFPWPGAGPIPTLTVADPIDSQGTVRLRIDPTLRSELRPPRGFRRLGSEADPRRMAGADRPETMVVTTFSYATIDGPLLLSTTPLPRLGSTAVIQEATLTSVALAGDRLRHRLVLDVVASSPTPLSLRFPAGVVLERCTVDGRTQPAVEHEAGVALSLEGPGFSVIQLEYTSPTPAGSADAAIVATGPSLAIPCMASNWQVVLPEPWSPVVETAGLLEADPETAVAGWRMLAAPLFAVIPGGVSVAESRSLDDLNRVVGTTAAHGRAGSSLANLLLRWDATRSPLVIDRMALTSIGVGPASRVEGPPASRVPALRGILRPLGLTVAPVENALLVTTLADDPTKVIPHWMGASAWWRDRLREAVAWGADRTDRFQRPDRWAKESAASGRMGPAPLRAITPDWSTARLAVSGRLPTDSRLEYIDRQAWHSGAWALALATAALGWTCRRASARKKVSGLTLAVAVSLGGAALGGPRVGTLAAGLLWGSLGGGVLWIVRRAFATDRLASAALMRRRGTTVTRALTTSSLLVGLGVGAAPRGQPIEDGGPLVEAPIVAFIPYDGALPDLEPERVWLSLRDHQRLSTLADNDPGSTRPEPLIGALSAKHHVRLTDASAFSVESRLELWREGDAPAEWSFGVGSALDLTAELDGRSIPVFVEPGGQLASIDVVGESGRHTLVIRRRVARRPFVTGESLDLPINRVATTTVEVQTGAAGRPSTLYAAGSVTDGPDGSMTAELGPVDRLELRWDPAGRGALASEPGSVEGSMVWRADPAGDGLEARLRLRGGAGIDTVRLMLDAGVVLRLAAIEVGTIETSVGPTVDGETFLTARFDPPLADGSLLRLELWRSNDGAAGARRPPGFRLAEGTRFEGLLALRRPNSWSGRLGRDEVLAGSLDEFERLWGESLDLTGMTTAGIVRLSRPPGADAGPEADLQPRPSRLEVRPTLELGFEAGRLDWRLEARIHADPLPAELLLNLPADLRLDRVEGAGLTHWEFSEPALLRLRFDDRSGGPGRLVVSGSIPLPSEPMRPGPTPFDRELPWPSWPDADVPVGILVLSAPVGLALEFEDTQGVRVLDPAFAVVDQASPGLVRYAPIELGNDTAGRIRWTYAPAVDVTVWSAVTVRPDSLDWEARVRYDVAGGAIDSLQLELPADWNETIRYEIAGVGPVQPRIDGTRVLLEPGRLLWGRADLILRSTRSREPDASLQFPRLTTLGRGQVRGHWLRLVDETSGGLIVEPTGLAPDDDASWPAPVEAGRRRATFRVIPPGLVWGLVARPSQPPSPAPHASAGVRWAEMEAVLGQDGRVRGLANYDLDPDAVNPFLLIGSPPGARPLMAAVDGRPTSPLEAGPGLWAVPLGMFGARAVELLWEGAGGPRVQFPNLHRSAAPTCATLFVADARPVAAGSSARSCTVSELEAWRAERSIRPGEGVASDSADFPALARIAERAARWGALIDPSVANLSAQRRVLNRVQAARLRQSETPPSEPVDGPTPRPRGLLLRRLGRPHAFLSTTTGATAPIVLDVASGGLATAAK